MDQPIEINASFAGCNEQGSESLELLKPTPYRPIVGIQICGQPCLAWPAFSLLVSIATEPTVEPEGITRYLQVQQPLRYDSVGANV
jgi:hypothetical protein